MRYRYYTLDKNSVQSNIKNAIENLELLFAQEAELIIGTDLVEVEGLNTFSCPPHFAQLIQSIKGLKNLQERVDCNSFLSLEKKEE